MSRSNNIFVVFILLIAFAAPFCICQNKTNGDYGLYPQFYDHSCPDAQKIVKSFVERAVKREPRMAASLLRLHFHDCFVKGCDASILLDSSKDIINEKQSHSTSSSVRGFKVIDRIKLALEKVCPQTVSCADITALAARDSTVLTDGPFWDVPLGRRDSIVASLKGSNNDLPGPTSTVQTMLTKFKRHGLNIVDLVALSGSHTIGKTRCVIFRQRLYNNTRNGMPDSTLDPSYAAQLRESCPQSGGDRNLFDLDLVSPNTFDNAYFKNLLSNKGLLSSDQLLVTQSSNTLGLVKKYANDSNVFFKQFAISMVKMGSISVLTGSSGEIRKDCRKNNS